MSSGRNGGLYTVTLYRYNVDGNVGPCCQKCIYTSFEGQLNCYGSGLSRQVAHSFVLSILCCVYLQCQTQIENSLDIARDLLNDVDLHVMMHDAFGKGFMKKCRMSPDAFIQMGLQLAYYRVRFQPPEAD